MLKFILKRVLQLLIVFFVTSILIFVMVRISDTDPVAVILGGKQTSPETVAAIREKFHLDKNVVEQYVLWITGMFRGDFGLSFKYQSAVSSLIVTRIPVTLGLVLIGSAIALLAAIPLGVLCSVKKHTWIDRSISVFSLILAGSPPFLTSIIMVLIISKINPAYPFIGSYSSVPEFLSESLCPPSPSRLS